MGKISDPKHPFWSILTVVALWLVLYFSANRFDTNEIVTVVSLVLMELVRRLLTGGNGSDTDTEKE